jgi:hypothetical protein
MLRWFLGVALLLPLAAAGRADPPAKDPKAALAKREKFPILEGQSYTLREAAEYFSDRHGLKIDVDEKLYKAAVNPMLGVTYLDVLAFTMHWPPAAQKAVSVGAYLQTALNQLPIASTYVLRGNGVVVVPVTEESIRPISQEARGSLVKPRLARSFAADQALADKPTLYNLVRYLSDKHDVQLVVSAGTDPEDYKDNEQYKLRLPRFGTVNLQTLLEQVAQQTRSKVLLRHDHVLVLTPDAGQPPTR